VKPHQPRALEQNRKRRKTTLDVLGAEDIFLATENIGEATGLALHAAQARLAQDADEPLAVE
jgi:hypothetical protein